MRGIKAALLMLITPAVLSVAISLIRHSTRHQNNPNFLQFCLENIRTNVETYSCDFVRQERVNGKLLEKHESRVFFRSTPFSVYMENVGDARKLWYVQDKIVKKNKRYMVIEPDGVIVRILFGKRIEIAIDDPRVMAKTRKQIDEFGFENTLKTLILSIRSEDCDKFYLEGEGLFNGRKAYTYYRTLKDSSLNPAKYVRFYIDQEWLIPIGVYSYSDREATILLGEYVYGNVKINVDLDPNLFE